MYVGHYGVAFAARKLEPRLGLGPLFLATQWLDVAFAAFFAAGVESARFTPENASSAFPYEGVLPYSHSLAGALMLAALLAVPVGAWLRSARAALVTAAVVLSHWVLDWLTHVGDVRLWPSGPGYGLGLFGSVPGRAFIELTFLLAGVYLYMRSGARFDRHRLARLVGFLILSDGAVLVPALHTADLSHVPLMGVLFVGLAAYAWRTEDAAATGAAAPTSPRSS